MTGLNQPAGPHASSFYEGDDLHLSIAISDGAYTFNGEPFGSDFSFYIAINDDYDGIYGGSSESSMTFYLPDYYDVAEAVVTIDGGAVTVASEEVSGEYGLYSIEYCPASLLLLGGAPPEEIVILSTNPAIGPGQSVRYEGAEYGHDTPAGTISIEGSHTPSIITVEKDGPLTRFSAAWGEHEGDIHPATPEFYAPYEWSYTEEAPYSAIVQIIPVVLLAALIAGLAASVARRGP